jgi:hypothetical protein
MGDAYAGIFSNFTGFFYTAAISILANSNSVFATNSPFTVMLENNHGCNYSQNLWADNLETVPAIVNIFVDSNVVNVAEYYTYVSGVLVFKTATACNYNFWIQTSNIGCNFIVETPVTVGLSNSIGGSLRNLNVAGSNAILYSDSAGTVLTTSFTNADANTFFSWSNVSLSNYSAGPSNPFYLGGSAKNLYAVSDFTQQVIATEIGEPLYFDSRSIQTIALTSDSNFYAYATGTTLLTGSNTYPNSGQRVISGNNLNPSIGSFGGIYVHSNIISSGTYSNELQIVNGYFTGSNIYSYLNYSSYYSPLAANPNYTSIPISGGIRWATFSWYIPFNIRRTVTATINFCNHNFTSTSNYIAPGVTFWSFNGIFFVYKIVGKNANTTSGWLNANIRLPTITSRSNMQTDGYQGGFVSATIPSSSNTQRSIVIGDNITTGDSIGVKPYNLYIRIGYPVTSNFYFTNIQLSNINQK